MEPSITHPDKKIHTFCQPSPNKFGLRKRLTSSIYILVLLTFGLLNISPMGKPNPSTICSNAGVFIEA